MKKFFMGLAAIVCSSLVHAQDSSKVLHEVVITATKFPIKQSQTGKVITVINKDEIAKSEGRTLSQLLNEQAGITINGALNNAGATQSLFMRGAGTGRTLILLDGIPVYDPSFLDNGFDLNLFSLANIESIEICRGAQSTLYGSDAIAGVVNIISIKKDVKKKVNVKGTLAAGNFNTYKGNVQVYGVIDKLSYTARFATHYTDGFSAAYDSSGKKNFDDDKYRGGVGNIALQYQLNAKTQFRTFFQQSKYTSDIDAGIFADEKDFAIKNNQQMAGAGFTYNDGKVNITGNYQYSDVTRKYKNDSLDKPGFTTFSTDNYFGKNQFVEIFGNVKMGNHFRLLQGADFRFSNMNSQFFSLSSFGPYASNTKDSVQSQASLYTSLFFTHLHEKLNIELGGRLNVHSAYGSNYTYTFNPSFSLNDHFRIFSSVATGFKAPSLYQLYSSYGKPDLEPEVSTNYEIGVSQAHDKWQSRLVYFYRNIKDGIDFNNVKFAYVNINKQKVRGLEVETSFQPIQKLTFSANYAYLNPTESSQSRVTFKDTTYKHLLRRPEHMANVAIGYQISNALFARVAGKYVGERKDAGGYKKQDVNLDEYFLLNAYASYALQKHIKFFVDFQNITDRKFFDLRGYNSIPFTFTGGVSIDL